MRRVETIRTLERFESVLHDWNDLARRDGPPLPYLRHEWLSAWWRGFGERAALAIFVARDGETLTAALPLMRSWRTLAGVPLRALHSIGSNVGFPDLLRDPDHPDDLGLVLEAALLRGGTDVLLVKGTLARSPKDAWVRDWLKREGYAYETAPCGEFYLDAREGVTGYHAGRPSKLLNNASKRSRQLSRQGTVSYERVRGGGPWDPALEEALGISMRSWKARSGTAIGQQPCFRVFLAELARRFGPRDEVELCFLRVNGTAIAFRMGVSDREVFVDQEIAFDEAWRRYSPGTLVALHSDEALISAGIREINLGIDFSWKENWAPLHRERIEWIIYPKGSPLAAFARAARRVREGLVRKASRQR